MPEAILYSVDGTQKSVEPENGKDFSLKELQGFVNGYIELVYLTKTGKPSKALICNEEGKLEGLPVNEKATSIWKEYYGDTDMLVGNCLICDTEFMK